MKTASPHAGEAGAWRCIEWRRRGVEEYISPTNAIVQASTAPSGYSSGLSRTRKTLDKKFTYHAKHLVTATKEYISTVDAEEHILKNSC